MLQLLFQELHLTVRDILLENHPSPHLPKPSVLVSPSDFSPLPFHPALFDNIDGILIHCTILHMDGAAGPSGLYVASWKKLCTAFQEASDTLCDALSAIARRLAASLVDLASLSAFTACRLIALDKHPGVRPIGVGEICRRLLSRAVLCVIRNDCFRLLVPCNCVPANLLAVKRPSML